MGDRFHETLHIFCVQEERDLRAAIGIGWGFACFFMDFGVFGGQDLRAV